MNRGARFLVVMLTLSGLALASVARPGVGAAQGYQGVVPGSKSSPGNAARPTHTDPVVTWPGFQVLGDGGTRVFVQTSVAVQPELVRDGKNWVLRIPGVRLPKGNARLPLDTHFFNTPVGSARMAPMHTTGKRRRKRQAGTGVSLLLEMRADATPKLRTEKADNGYFFTYLEFAPGKYD